MQNTIKNIPILDLKRQYREIKKEVEPAVLNVLSSGGYILGKTVEEFERSCAEYLGAKYAIGVNSGTDALQLGLMAYDIGPGDEVITTCFSFYATAEVISTLGAKPVFVDIEPDTFNIDVSKIEQAITDKTKAIIPVHLYGQSADMDKIMEIAKKYNLAVIEDCAQSFGSKYKNKFTGTIGDVGAFSFFPTKNLGAAGDGGLVTTNDDKLAEKIQILRVHGSKVKYFHDYIGINSRLDALQAAILSIKLKYIDKWNKGRGTIAKKYTEKLKGSKTETPYMKEDRDHIFHQFTIKVPDRDQLQEFLKTRGVSTFIYYPLSLHLQPVYENLGYKKGSFPVAEDVQNKVLSLPAFPELTDDEIDYVTGSIKEFYK
ncbi:MAG: DegT/DnrJ/EryC1/StrS family aminotransferase [Armatimonadota bacterium]